MICSTTQYRNKNTIVVFLIDKYAAVKWQDKDEIIKKNNVFSKNFHTGINLKLR